MINHRVSNLPVRRAAGDAKHDLFGTRVLNSQVDKNAENTEIDNYNL